MENDSGGDGEGEMGELRCVSNGVRLRSFDLRVARADELSENRQDRLVALTRDADEKNYLLRLERSGTPEQREHWGRTVNGAVGVWLLDAVQTKAASKAEQVLDETKSKPKSSGPNVVGSWSKRNGEPVGEEHGYTFKCVHSSCSDGHKADELPRPGTILRFTPTTPEDSSSRPRPPPGAIKKHPQGTLLEMKDGKLIVSFEEDDIWFLGDEDYRCVQLSSLVECPH